MIITLCHARNTIAEYAGKAGKCADSEDARLFVLEAVQRLLHRGAHGNLRKWVFCLSNGCFTAPADMEVPIKVKIDGYPERVWSKWYEFYDVHNADFSSTDFKSGLIEEVNVYFTAYDIPVSGARVAAIPLESEAASAYIVVQGEDVLGRDVYTMCDGCRIHGEKLLISREEPVFSRTAFSKITGIEKTPTCNYVRLYWQEVVANQVAGRGFLAEYKPAETHPSFRRFRVPAAASNCSVKVTVLGRVRDIDYRHNNDVLPITSLAGLRKMAQLMQAEQNEKIDVAAYHEQSIDKAIENENEYHKTGDDPFDFIFETSPGAIENLQ